MYNITANFDFFYTFPIRNALRDVANHLGFTLTHDASITSSSIHVNGKPVGYILYSDAMHFLDDQIIEMNSKDYKKIFKFHYSPNLIDYPKLFSQIKLDTKYLDKIVPCGLWRPWDWETDHYKGWNKNHLMTKPRSIDVISAMRYSNSGTPPWPNLHLWPQWSFDRLTLIKQAQRLKGEGYNTITEMTGRDVYADRLADTKIGFIWSASSYLGWKIPEFIQEGVVMITEPLGKDYPLCNDVILEDGVHCVFEKNPKNFADVAKELLNDPATLNKIKENCLNLWEDKWSPSKVGQWFFKELIEGYKQT
jgi:hypothetical protein